MVNKAVSNLEKLTKSKQRESMATSMVAVAMATANTHKRHGTIQPTAQGGLKKPRTSGQGQKSFQGPKPIAPTRQNQTKDFAPPKKQQKKKRNRRGQQPS